MMHDEMRTFGYLCPKCGKSVMGTRSVFALEASNAEEECECGESRLQVKFDGEKYQIYVSCGRLPAGAYAPRCHGAELQPDQAVFLLHRRGRHCGKESSGTCHSG